jgi:coenzyme PQQ precursor peptide PqqA
LVEADQMNPINPVIMGQAGRSAGLVGDTRGNLCHNPRTGGRDMKKWSKPKFQNLRYGFEINLYVKVR